MTKFIEKSKLIMERIKESSNIDFEVDDVFIQLLGLMVTNC